MRWFCIGLICAALFSEEKQPEFWSTGPLINYSDDVVELGHVAFQPYFIYYQYRGSYDSDWHFHSFPMFSSFLFQPFTRIGICPRVEFNFTPQLYYNHVDGAAKWVFGDMPISLSFWLLEETKKVPSIMFNLLANLPTGKYQKLNPAKLETDLGGTGSWSPGAAFVIYKEIYLWKAHYLAFTYSATYLFQTLVDVKGLSLYGGGPGTHGKVRPGNLFQSDLSLQYSFTQNWVFSMDMIYQHQDRSRFSGVTVEPAGNRSLEQCSLAPALEYLWDENTGIVFGSWFSVAGRNTDQFNTFEISIYMYR
ncbi:MAG: transporter [Parachlamydiales bacterium]|nr:transporter [Parachlamydiales bacterium]